MYECFDMWFVNKNIKKTTKKQLFYKLSHYTSESSSYVYLKALFQIISDILYILK